MKRKLVFIMAVAVVCATVFICGCMGGNDTPPADQTPVPTAGAEKIALKVFHAGSLTSPMEKMEAEFEAKHSNVDVQLHPGGSTKLAKEITELGAAADVFASADYTLIPELMIPDDASWYVTFAKNQMVLCYTDKSKFADEVTADNWYDILGREGVTWGFSDPNLDPCGYRSLMTIVLAELNYNDDTIFENLVGQHSKITSTVEDGVVTVHAKETGVVYPITITPKSVELIAGLESGNLDYAWEYRSVAEQNAASGVKFIELPEAIDLSSVAYEDTYAKVQIDTAGGMLEGKPIVYGVTVPKTADNPDTGVEFVSMLIGPTGQQIMADAGQPPIVPPGGFFDIPAALKDMVEMTA
jgi:molybdate/tungstate transport system substrate-binding protein